MKLYGYVGNVEDLKPGDLVEILVFEAGPIVPFTSCVEFSERFAVVLPPRDPQAA